MPDTVEATAEVVRNGAKSPLVTFSTKEQNPKLFSNYKGVAAVTDFKFDPVNAQFPVQAGDGVILWGTGLDMRRNGEELDLGEETSLPDPDQPIATQLYFGNSADLNLTYNDGIGDVSAALFERPFSAPTLTELMQLIVATPLSCPAGRPLVFKTASGDEYVIPVLQEAGPHLAGRLIDTGNKAVVNAALDVAGASTKRIYTGVGGNMMANIDAANLDSPVRITVEANTTYFGMELEPTTYREILENGNELPSRLRVTQNPGLDEITGMTFKEQLQFHPWRDGSGNYSAIDIANRGLIQLVITGDGWTDAYRAKLAQVPEAANQPGGLLLAEMSLMTEAEALLRDDLNVALCYVGKDNAGGLFQPSAYADGRIRQGKATVAIDVLNADVGMLALVHEAVGHFGVGFNHVGNGVFLDRVLGRFAVEEYELEDHWEKGHPHERTISILRAAAYTSGKFNPDNLIELPNAALKTSSYSRQLASPTNVNPIAVMQDNF